MVSFLNTLCYIAWVYENLIKDKDVFSPQATVNAMAADTILNMGPVFQSAVY